MKGMSDVQRMKQRHRIAKEAWHFFLTTGQVSGSTGEYDYAVDAQNKLVYVTHMPTNLVRVVAVKASWT